MSASSVATTTSSGAAGGQNGLTRRTRSNSAPAVLELEREFGRQLRQISDEFNLEHQPASSRAWRTSTVRATSTSSSCAVCLSLVLVLTANVIVDVIGCATLLPKVIANFLVDLLP